MCASSANFHEEPRFGDSPERADPMKILYDWLKEFVEFTATPEELRSRLSLSGTAIDSVEQTEARPAARRRNHH